MIQLDNNKKVPLYEQIYMEIRKCILSGEYVTNYQLQPIRVMAKELKVSHNTVNRAYQQLLAEGYIRATQGSGFYVEEMYTMIDSKKKILQKTFQFVEPKETERTIKYDFSRSKFVNEGFSWGKWARYVQNAIIDAAYKDNISECKNKGNYELRREICDYVHKKRAVDCSPEQIVICPTTEHAMEIIINVLPDDVYKVGMEEPGSEKMRRILKGHGYEIEPIPVYENGIDVNYLEKTDCNLLYLTPSFQFPKGVTIPLVKRIQTLEWCRRNNVYCIENDYENEFLFGNKPIMSMQSLDKHQNVIYISTFSNVMTTEIKCSFIVFPKSLIKAYEDKYEYYRSYMSDYEQVALSRYIHDGHLERLSRKMAIINRRKKDIFFNYVQENMSDIMCCYSVEAGTHHLIKIYGCEDSESMMERLKDHGIIIYPTREFWYEKINAPRDVFMLSFSCILEKDMYKACSCFEKELRDILGK